MIFLLCVEGEFPTFIASAPYIDNNNASWLRFLVYPSPRMSHNLAALAKPDLIRFDLKLNKVQLRPKETRPVWPKLGGYSGFHLGQARWAQCVTRHPFLRANQCHPAGDSSLSAVKSKLTFF